MRAYIGCFGSGLGHASRMLEVARELSARGWGVEFSSSGEVTAMIRTKGFRCNDLPLSDVRYSVDGSFSLRETLASSPSIAYRAWAQLRNEVVSISRFCPDVVLSDSALPTVLASRLSRTPTFTVLNQLNLAGADHGGTPGFRLLSVGVSSGMGKLWELSDQVLLPDLPPPFTISEKNLWGSGVGKTRYIGFLGVSRPGPPDSAGLEFSSVPRPKVFWQVSGPPRTRKAFYDVALRFADGLRDRFAFVISAGRPDGDVQARAVPGGWVYEWCENPGYYFATCDVVVSRAGHGTIAQAITASKPSLLVPIPRQPEQEGNAEKAERLGIAKRADQEGLTESGIRDSLTDLLKPDFSKNAEKISRIARNFNATKAIVDTLESSAH